MAAAARAMAAGMAHPMMVAEQEARSMMADVKDQLELAVSFQRHIMEGSTPSK